MHKKSTILIIVRSLELGGAERQALTLAKSLAVEKNSVEMVQLFSGKNDFYTVPKNIQHSVMQRIGTREGSFDSCGALMKMYYLLKACYKTRLFLRHKKTIIGSKHRLVVFGAGLGVLVSLLDFKNRRSILVLERISPDPLIYKPSVLARFGRPFIYKIGVRCGVQTEGFRQWTESNWRINSFITPNFYERQLSVNRELSQQANRYFLFVGRFAEQKNFARLMNVWRMYEERFPYNKSRLLVVTNDNFGLLKSQIIALNISKLEILEPIPPSDLDTLVKGCIALISLSKFEGFPNVVAEAITVGAKVVCTLSSDVIRTWSNANLCTLIGNQDDDELIKILDNLEKTPPRPPAESELIAREFFYWDACRNYWLDALFT